MKPLSTILLLLFAAGVSAQEGYEIKVTLKPFKNEYVYLGHYSGGQLPVVDSARLNDKSETVFKGSKKLGGGIYFVAYPDKNRILEFLLDKEQKFSIVADTADIRQAQFINSPDNIAFQAYQNEMIRRGSEMEALLKKQREAKTQKDSAAVAAEIKDFNAALQAYRTNLMEQGPQNMLTTLLKWMREPDVPKDPAAEKDSTYAYRYFKSHYWDDTYFFDDRLTRTPFFENKLDKYFQQLVFPSADSVIKEIDWMMSFAGASEEMEKWMLLKFINRYYNQRYMWEDKVFVHLFEKYVAPKQHSWMSESGRKMITDRAYNLMSNITGNPAPEISLPDTSGITRSLYSIKAPYLLLAIYDPMCGHCKETLPRIDSMYHAKWKAEGLKVMAFAKETEGQKQDWLSFIKNHTTASDWVHVYSSKASEELRVKANTPSYGQLYDVQSFPTLYLLDKDKRIVAKKLGFEQIGEILEHLQKTASK